MRRRYFQYSLKTLLIFFTLAAVYLGLETERVTKQRKALNLIEAVGGNSYYAYEFDAQNKSLKNRSQLRAPGPSWLHSLVGEDYFRTVVSLSFEHTTRVGDEELHELSNLLPHVRSMWLTDTGVTDDGLRHLLKFKRLEKLSLAKTDVGDEGMRLVGQCTRLRNLQLTDTRVTDSGLQYLTNLSNLGTIGLSRTEITDEGIKHLGAASPRNLRWLNLNHTNISNSIVDHLTLFPTIDFLSVQNTSVNSDGVSKIREAFPHCMIVQTLSDGYAARQMFIDKRYRPD